MMALSEESGAVGGEKRGQKRGCGGVLGTGTQVSIIDHISRRKDISLLLRSCLPLQRRPICTHHLVFLIASDIEIILYYGRCDEGRLSRVRRVLSGERTVGAR